MQQQLPPGLAGYLAGQQQSQQGQLGQLQQAQMMMGLQGAIQQQQQQQAERQAIAQLGPNPTAEQLGGIVARRDPSKAYDIMARSEDRKTAMTQRAEEAQARIEDRRAALEQRKAEFDQRQADAQTRAQFEQMYKMEMLKLNQANSALQAQMKQMGIELQQSRAESATQQQTQRQVQQLGTALERANLPEADAVLRGVEEAMRKRPDLAEYLSGVKSLAPDLMVDKDIASGRQAFQKLFNITLKNRSGAAVTNQELDRLKNEFATGAWKTPDQLKAGVEQARKIISDHYRSVAAGFGPEALKGYNDNLRQTGGTPILEPQGAAPAPQQFREGQTATGPNGQKIIFRGGQWQPAR